MSYEPSEESQARHSNPGQFKPGNTAAMTHGGRSQRVALGQTPEQADAVAALAERVSSIVSDCGGVESVSALKLSLIERHARLEIVESYLWTNLEANGVLTGKGRQRAALTAYLSVADRLQRSAVTLGLERRAKRVESLADILRQHEAEQK